MLASILFLSVAATSALASPSSRGTSFHSKRTCTSPGTYRCAADHSTMEVCDLAGAWETLNPGCPSGTACEDNPFGTNIPYCMVKSNNSNGGQPSGTCPVQNQFSCYTDASSGQSGIKICDLSNNWQVVGACPGACGYIYGTPYCL